MPRAWVQLPDPHKPVCDADHTTAEIFLTERRDWDLTKMICCGREPEIIEMGIRIIVAALALCAFGSQVQAECTLNEQLQPSCRPADDIAQAQPCIGVCRPPSARTESFTVTAILVVWGWVGEQRLVQMRTMAECEHAAAELPVVDSGRVAQAFCRPAEPQEGVVKRPNETIIPLRQRQPQDDRLLFRPGWHGWPANELDRNDGQSRKNGSQ